MRTYGVVLVVLATWTAYMPLAAASWEREPFPVQEEDRESLESANYQGYRPAWANPYALPPEVGINDDPTPFFPADVDDGASPLDPDAF